MHKILVVATSSKTRGGITSVINSHKEGEHWSRYNCKWIETHRDGNYIRKIFYFIKSLFQFIFYLPSSRLIHIHVATRQSALRKLIFFWIASFFRKKTILHFHPSNEEFLFEQRNKKLYRYLFENSNLVLVLSKQWKTWLNEALGPLNNVEVLYNPCPSILTEDIAKEKYILFAGSIIKRKGYSDLLKAFSKISELYPDWNIKIAGNGEIEEAKKLAIDLKIDSKVEFTGWVKDKEKEHLFKHASIYCLPSSGEGFPMGVLDAWAYQIPCVVTPVGGIPDIITDGLNGLIFEVGNYEQLSEKLSLLISDENLRFKINKNTDILINNEFNSNLINSKLDNIYSNLLE